MRTEICQRNASKDGKILSTSKGFLFFCNEVTDGQSSDENPPFFVLQAVVVQPEKNYKF